MEFLYPISYIASLTGLVAWFFAQGQKRFSRPASALFIVGFLVYLCALAFSSATFSYKLLILCRDLLVLAVVSQVFNFISKYKILSIILLVVAALTVYFSYYSVLKYTFPQLPIKLIDEQGEFLVRAEEGHQETIASLTDEFDCTIERAFTPMHADKTRLDDYYLINLKKNSKRAWKKLYRHLLNADGLDWIEPNEIIELSRPETTPPQQKSSSRFYANDPGLIYLWGFEQMAVNDLHRMLDKSGVKPRKVARVAIIDSGVDAGHEDLRDNYVTTRSDYDTDANGHGTHCAGIAGAVSNNNIGIASFPPRSGYIEITAVQVMNKYGLGNQQKVISGMIEAVDSGADVLSMSLGSRSTQKSEKAYLEAVEYALDHGVIVVVSAGNSNDNAMSQVPANVKGVIAVSAIDRDGRKATFSNTVEDIRMGIAAPGVDIYSTLPDNRYAMKSGTSMSAPYVAGLVGLMKSFYPEMSAEEAHAILQKTGKKTKDGAKTGRLIQPLAAVESILD